MVYRCENCGFLFSRIGPIQTCPACERSGIRPAAPEEEVRFLRMLHGEAPSPERGIS